MGVEGGGDEFVPCIIEHPLDQTGGCVLVAAVALEVGAMALVNGDL